MYGNAKAIETVYNGYKFRSRLEARWAVFFDSLGVEYEYEPEGFDLTEYAEEPVYYLPDFYLPELDCFMEVKGQKPTEEEENKCHWLAEAAKKDVFILWGKIECPTGYLRLNDDQHYWHAPGCRGTAYWWCECLKCGLIGIEHLGNAKLIPCDCETDRGSNYDSPRLLEAYRKAKQARFEFDFRSRAIQ